MERIFHTWDQWECYPAGFYETKPPHKDMTIDECKQAYADFLRDSDRFRHAGLQVLLEWPNSCEHYLTNERMIAPNVLRPPIVNWVNVIGLLDNVRCEPFALKHLLVEYRDGAKTV